MPRVRLDEARLEELRSWGEKLRQGGGDESVAVGRAILMLVDEIDRLHVELWHARIEPTGGVPLEADVSAENDEEPVASSLRARLKRVLSREDAAQPMEQSLSDAPESASTSAQAWIAALRRDE